MNDKADIARKRTNSNELNLAVDDGRVPVEQTVEEKLLAALLMANADLMEAFRQYEDLERVAMERKTEERSRKEIRMERKVSHIFSLPPKDLQLILAFSIETSRTWLYQSYRQAIPLCLLHHVLARTLPNSLTWLILSHNIFHYRRLITNPSS